MALAPGRIAVTQGERRLSDREFVARVGRTTDATLAPGMEPGQSALLVRDARSATVERIIEIGAGFEARLAATPHASGARLGNGLRLHPPRRPQVRTW